MIYGNVGAGLVGAQLPDNSGLLEQGQKLSAAAWGIPEMDDIAAPELQYEKDVDTDWTQGLNDYYGMGKSLAQNALRLRQVGIDVTKPNPFVKNSIEAASLWQQDYNDWLELGKRLKQSREQKKSWQTQAASPNVLSTPFPGGQELADATQYLIPIDDKPAQNAAKAWSNTWKTGVYGQKNLEELATEYDAAVNAVNATYDAQKKMYADNPDAVAQLEQRKQDLLASMTPPQFDQKFADMLEFKKQQEANKTYRAGLKGQDETTKVSTNTWPTMAAMVNNQASPEILSGMPSGKFVTNKGKYVLDGKGQPIPLITGKYIGMEKKSDGITYAKFTAINGNVSGLDENDEPISGNIGTIEIPAFDKNGVQILDKTNFYRIADQYMQQKNLTFSGFGPNWTESKLGATKAPTVEDVKIQAPSAPQQPKQQQPKKEIKKSDIPVKAKAAGYSVAEYTKLLQQKGVSIIQ